MATVYFVLLSVLILACKTNGDFPLTILHTSGMTSAFEQFDSSGGDCSTEEDRNGECFGGISRHGTVINNVRNERDDVNVCLLDSGTPLLGPWFEYDRVRATYFMNKLGFDAMTLGHQELINGPILLGLWLDDINFDMLSANVNTAMTPALQGRIGKSVVKNFGDERVGIIGYGTQAFNEIVEHNAFDDPIEVIQKEVDALTSIGVNKIIVLGQSLGSGVEDTEVADIARNVSGVDIMVIGGLDIYQYDDDNSPPGDVPACYTKEQYPIVVTPNDDPEGTVLIVHGNQNTTTLGRLNVRFNEEGKINGFYGGPILLDSGVEEDPALLTEVTDWEGNVGDRVVGTTNVFLQGAPRENSACRREECNLGNLLADAMIRKYVDSLADEEAENTTIIAFMNGGGIRDSIEEGEIRYVSDIQAVLPFTNTFDSVELKGRYVREMLEQAVSTGVDSQPGWFLQVAGLKVSYDLCEEANNGRVVDVQVLKHLDCMGSYYEPLDDDRVYKVIMPSFIARGGDGFQVVPTEGENYVIGDLGEDVLAEYITRYTPITRYVEGRITFAEGDCTGSTQDPTSVDSTSTFPTTTVKQGGGGRGKPRKMKGRR